jgi:hypothetical protein
LLEGRLRHYRADAVGQRIAFDRQVEKVRVQVVVAVLVVVGADRVGAGTRLSNETVIGAVLARTFLMASD